MKTVKSPSAVRLNTELARRVLLLRYWHHTVNEELKLKKFKIPIHVAFGHEALAVAVSNVMLPNDQIALSHRNIAYNLAREGALAPILKEYLLENSGVAEGRLGSMNLANPKKGVVYSSSILGNNLAVASGLALAKQLAGKNDLVIVLTGDGAIEEGAFYESLVFSKSQKLPLLIIVENNCQSMSSTIEERRCPINLAEISSALKIPFQKLEGNNVFKYEKKIAALRKQVFAQSTPVCVEVELAALNQHAGPTPGWPTDPKKISLENGLIVEKNDRDPAYVLQETVGCELFDEMSASILKGKLGW